MYFIQQFAAGTLAQMRDLDKTQPLNVLEEFIAIKQNQTIYLHLFNNSSRKKTRRW